jgi:acyl carrier protein
LTRSFVLVQGLHPQMSNPHGPDRDKSSRLLEIISSEIVPSGCPVHEDADLFEAGLDSMAIMQLLIRIETEFGVQLRVADITRDNFSTIRKIAGLIA